MLSNITAATNCITNSFYELMQITEELQSQINELKCEITFLKESNANLQNKVNREYTFNQELRDFLTRY